MSYLGKTLIILGGAMVLLGVVVLAAGHIPWLGNLPGDVRIKGKKWSFYFPIATCIVISIVLTLLLNLIARFFWKK